MVAVVVADMAVAMAVAMEVAVVRVATAEQVVKEVKVAEMAEGEAVVAVAAGTGLRSRHSLFQNRTMSSNVGFLLHHRCRLRCDVDSD